MEMPLQIATMIALRLRGFGLTGIGRLVFFGHLHRPRQARHRSAQGPGEKCAANCAQRSRIAAEATSVASFFARVRGRRDHPDSERGHPRRVVELVPGKGKSVTKRNELIFIIQTNKRRILSKIRTCHKIHNIAQDKLNLLYGK